MLKISLNIYLIWFVLYFYMLNLFRYTLTTKGIILNIQNKIVLYVFHVPRNMIIARRLECRLSTQNLFVVFYFTEDIKIFVQILIKPKLLKSPVILKAQKRQTTFWKCQDYRYFSLKNYFLIFLNHALFLVLLDPYPQT